MENNQSLSPKAYTQAEQTEKTNESEIHVTHDESYSTEELLNELGSATNLLELSSADKVVTSQSLAEKESTRDLTVRVETFAGQSKNN